MAAKSFKNPLPSSDYEKRVFPRKEDVRGSYLRDQTAIIHSLAYRRLKHKTQVFFSPNNDHVCTRIEHSLHVATIAATIARALRLNDEMAFAIGLGHDLGHAPFGHAGESKLNELTEKTGGFIHELHGLRVVDVLGNRGKSLNLTYGVRDGILCHCGESLDQSISPRRNIHDLDRIKDKSQMPISWEGCIVRIADRIAYLGRDLEDAIDGGFIKKSSIPRSIFNALGSTNGEIIDTLVIDVIKNSQNKGDISLSKSKYEMMKDLHNYSANEIYRHKKLARYADYCSRIVSTLFEYFLDLHDQHNSNFSAYKALPTPADRSFGHYLKNMSHVYRKEKTPARSIIRDYIAGMTDDFALKCMKEISLPEELIFEKRAH